jgi:hypothetical protein
MGFAAPVLLRPTFERLLDSYLRARLDPSPEQTQAQEQDQGKQQERELTHVSTVISTYAVSCQEEVVEDGGGCRGWSRLVIRKSTVQSPC